MKNLDEIKHTISKYLPLIASSQKQILGFINSDGDIYPTGLDSKIVGRLFEVVSRPILLRAAKELGVTLKESPSQTTYPDFWLEDPKEPNKNRISIDIKSTYRKGKKEKYEFTLGSYTSFLRNGTKNIAGNYEMYSYHLILGFIYSRNKNINEYIVSYENRSNIMPSIYNIQSFIAEKYKIAGEKPGSGNTANIGSVSAPLATFTNECGPFSYLGKDVFKDYWRNYPTPSERSNGKSKYKNILGYINWKKKTDEEKAELFKKQYQQYLNQ